MSHNIAANLSMPNLANSVTNAATKAMTNSSGSASSSSSSMDASNIGSTFLSLLTQELQNQDPTAPMDSTAMVGQMISLNQLSQLVSINQALGTATSTGTSGKTTTHAVGADANPDTSSAALQAASGSASALAMMFPSSQLGLAPATGTAAQKSLSTSLSALR